MPVSKIPMAAKSQLEHVESARYNLGHESTDSPLEFTGGIPLVSFVRIRLSDIPVMIIGFIISLPAMEEIISHGKYLLGLSEGLFFFLFFGNVLISMVVAHYLWQWMRRRSGPDRRTQEVPTVTEKQPPAYPTDQQMEELWKAHQSGEPGAIAEALRKRQEAQESNRKSIAGARPPAPAKNIKSVAQTCPDCGSLCLVQKTLRSGIYLECPNKKKAAGPVGTGVDCSFSKRIGDAPPLTDETYGPRTETT